MCRSYVYITCLQKGNVLYVKDSKVSINIEEVYLLIREYTV